MTEKELLVFIASQINICGYAQEQILKQLIFLNANEGVDVANEVKNLKFLSNQLNEHSKVLSKATKLVFGNKEE